MIPMIKTWIDTPALWYQFWLPRSGPTFWFAVGGLSAAMIAAVI
jgi:hypothetical protein